MVVIKYTFGTFLLLLVMACGGKNESAADNIDKELALVGNTAADAIDEELSSTLIFIDKTSSVAFREEDVINWKKSIKKFLEEKYRKKGDRFAVNYVHENTLGAGRAYMNKHAVDPLPDISRLGGRDRDRKVKEHKKECRNVCAEALKAVEVGLADNGNSSVKNETDLWATFEIMSRYFNQGNNNKNVIFISDMIESKRGTNRKQYHKNRFKSKEEAETAAKADAEFIESNYKIVRENLSDINVSILFPHGALDKSDKEYFMYYWEELFGLFGIEDVDEEV